MEWFNFRTILSHWELRFGETDDLLMLSSLP